MTKFLTVLFLALLLSLAQPWVTANAQLCSCPSDCNCPLFGCICGVIGDKCCDNCTCNVKFVTADAPTKMPAKDFSGATWHAVPGKPDFQYLACTDGTCAGVYQFSSKKWYPLTKATPGAEEYADACPCPVIPPSETATAAYITLPFAQYGTSGGCANGQCGGTSSPSSRGFGIFRR